MTAPPGYLQGVYRRIRAAGGLVVADEVQSGLCRLGDHMWGFEDSGVIPDIVTMGKPIGDGHPLAAVVTTPAIATEFARKFEYFNTFGGNPVSAAVGMAVLDVIEQENILQNVHDVGAYLGQGLKNLAQRCDLVGDVRGKGLFYGVELVSDRASLEPAANQAKRVVEDLRQNGVLLSRTGTFNNVLKIRPPMVFSKSNADVLLGTLEQALVAE
jgi:4-aminobutyrate aminotransferase-like enzyme